MLLANCTKHSSSVLSQAQPSSPSSPSSQRQPANYLPASWGRPLCAFPKLSAKEHEFADQPVDPQTGIMQWVGLDQPGAVARAKDMKREAGIDKVPDEQIMATLPRVEDGIFGGVTSSWCDELTQSLRRSSLEAVFIKLLRLPDIALNSFRNETFNSHFVKHSFGAWAMSMRVSMGWSVEEVFDKLKRGAYLALLAGRIKPRLPWDVFEFEGLLSATEHSEPAHPSHARGIVLKREVRLSVGTGPSLAQASFMVLFGRCSPTLRKTSMDFSTSTTLT